MKIHYKILLISIEIFMFNAMFASKKIVPSQRVASKKRKDNSNSSISSSEDAALQALYKQIQEARKKEDAIRKQLEELRIKNLLIPQSIKDDIIKTTKEGLQNIPENNKANIIPVVIQFMVGLSTVVLLKLAYHAVTYSVKNRDEILQEIRNGTFFTKQWDTVRGFIKSKIDVIRDWLLKYDDRYIEKEKKLKSLVQEVNTFQNKINELFNWVKNPQEDADKEGTITRTLTTMQKDYQRLQKNVEAMEKYPFEQVQNVWHEKIEQAKNKLNGIDEKIKNIEKIHKATADKKAIAEKSKIPSEFWKTQI